MKPVIALVGRPNVGKSTLFNRMTKSRDAIVADFAGLTRDRHYGDGRLGDREFICIDSGGFEPTAESGIDKEMAKQTRQAVAEADAVIFVVDVRSGVSGQDHDIARYLRTAGKKVLLAVNKAEGMTDGTRTAEFHELGIGEPHATSASNGQGIRSLLEAALADFDFGDDEAEDLDDPDRPIRLAVAPRRAGGAPPDPPHRDSPGPVGPPQQFGRPRASGEAPNCTLATSMGSPITSVRNVPALSAFAHCRSNVSVTNNYMLCKRYLPTQITEAGGEKDTFPVYLQFHLWRMAAWGDFVMLRWALEVKCRT